MPSYNHGEYISKSIDSIINQTYENWELIIVDNNSDDETKSVLKSYEKEKRIKVFFVNNHGSIGYSRNIGIKKSKSDFIAFIDSDDLWKYKKLEKCIIHLNTHDFIFHDIEVNYLFKAKRKKKSNTNNRIEKNALKTLLLYGNPIANSSVITKKDLIIKTGWIDESQEINRSVDFHTWLKIATITNKFKYVNNVLGENLIHENNLSLKNMMYSTKKATNNFVKYLNDKEIKVLKARLFFIDYSYKFHSKNFNEINFNNIYFSIWFGFLEIKLKSIIILVLTRIRLLIN